MSLEPWSEKYSVGLKLIDEQHKELINITLELSEGKKQNYDKIHLEEILDRLLAYVNLHFTTEEELLRIYEYPGYEEHKKSHHRFSSKVATLDKEFHSGDLELMGSVVLFLENWVKNHIQGDDKAWSEFITSKISDNE